MKIQTVLTILLLSFVPALAQSGRKVVEIKTMPEGDAPVPLLISSPDQSLHQPNGKPIDYRCRKDGSHTRILDSVETGDVFSAKMVDTRVVFRSKPRPGYTLEARRKRKQGFVILKVALSSMGTISRVRVLRGLPFGLTESAIKAACKLEFKPAIKDGQSVSQWVTAEYVFRLPDSRLFRP
ncbi:MAG: energy transducer TonB [Acidobacteriota bacterium]|nr:energy transducer TonB [Acidobacteriota bacterium]